MIYTHTDTKICSTLKEMREELENIGAFDIRAPYVYAFSNMADYESGKIAQRYHVEFQPNRKVKLQKYN